MNRLKDILQRNISVSQLSIFLTALVIAAIFYFLWKYTVIPMQAGVRSLATELEEVSAKINEIENFVGPNRSIAREIEALKTRYKYLSTKFSAGEDESMRLISKIAQSVSLEIISVKAEQKVYVKDLDKKPIKIDEKFFYRLPVGIECTGEYENIIKYLERLKEEIPAYIAVESLVVRAPKEGLPDLKAHLRINLYYAS